MTKIVGKFVLCHEDEGYRTGKITAAVSPMHYLVEFDAMDGSKEVAMPMEVVSVFELAELEEGEQGEDLPRRWGLFKTRKDRDGYARWLNSPDKTASIVSLVRKPDR